MIRPIGSDYTGITEALEVLQEEGLKGMGKAIELLMNTAMMVEREEYLKAGRYERSVERTGYANGFKPKSIKTRVGELELKLPQTRDGFYPSSLEKGLRSERALKLALAEMYVQGVSTRKVAQITEKLCGFSVTSDQVSQASKELDEILSAWRERPLGQYRYLFFDAIYEKVRQGNVVVSMAVLVAQGVSEDGHREIIGVSAKLSEAEVHWREFFQSLVSRGLHGIELITSDDHAGLKAALRGVFPSVPWQRCQFHLQQNAQSYIRRRSDRKKVGETIRDIFNAPNLGEAERLLKMAAVEYEKSNPELESWMQSNLAEGFTVFNIADRKLRKKLRTSNSLERVNKEIRRRTRVVSIFPNSESCLRLISAILMESSEEWMREHRFIALDGE